MAHDLSSNYYKYGDNGNSEVTFNIFLAHTISIDFPTSSNIKT